MSSFICSPKHFNSIEKSVIYLTQDSNFYFPYSFKNTFPELYDKRHYSQDKIDLKVKQTIDTLRELNVLCVSLQYKHHYPGTLDKEIAEQLEVAKMKDAGQSLTNISLLKQLQCLNYQIETEHLKELRSLTPDEENAMFFIEELKNALAMDIINKLPDYDKSPWGID
jgi:hypothetical protein